MKKTLLALSIAGIALAAGMAHAAAPIKVITSEGDGYAASTATVTVEVAANKSVSAKVVESTGNASADARIEKLVARSVDPAIALKGVGEGKGVRYAGVPVTIQYVASGGCVAPMSSSAADIIDPTVVCASVARIPGGN